MDFMTYEERLARRKFRSEIEKYSDKDLYFEVKSKIGLNNGLSKLELIVLERSCSLNSSLNEISNFLEKPVEKIESYYKNGIRKLKRMLFESKKELFMEVVKKELEKTQKKKCIQSKLWIDYIDEMSKKTDLEIYNLISRETVVKEKLCSERNLMISEELILKGSTLKSVADKYLISPERARQIKVDCLFYIKRYNYNLKNNKV